MHRYIWCDSNPTTNNLPSQIEISLLHCIYKYIRVYWDVKMKYQLYPGRLSRGGTWYFYRPMLLKNTTWIQEFLYMMFTEYFEKYPTNRNVPVNMKDNETPVPPI